ncbi:hypothetical protein SAMN02745134_00287 [Clostridium acidisoli DSM 12555]|uniref:Uncharacterized protein n=1 Tax=Clostridium acidisoli DSM 12555 TaxID=1121291 RepID=A0A1W1X073_9CLOT|nr:hypothetical protein [Clostridium acidisoli]SMC17305.1 hypothetical protein SAMN02745134_00287 [Clostridium acidisoli DSM 12555]
MCKIVKKLNKKLIAALEENVELRKKNLGLEEVCESFALTKMKLIMKIKQLEKNQITNSVKGKHTFVNFSGTSSELSRYLKKLMQETEGK